jgi:AraC-like DNA-binding protein
MALYEPILPARYLVPLFDVVALMREDDRRKTPALAALDRIKAAGATAVLTISEVETLLEAVSQLTGRQDLGFEIGRRLTLDHHGALAVWMRRCTSVDQLLRLLIRYSRLITPVLSFDYRRRGSVAEYSCTPNAAMSGATMRVLLEAFAVATHVILHALLGSDLEPYDLHMSIAEPPHASRYDELYPARVHFGEGSLPRAWIFLPATVLDRPLKGVMDLDPSMSPQELDALQGEIEQSRQWSGWIRMMLREAEGCQPTAEELTEILGVDTHTLARTLAKEGLSFREMAKQVRFEKACELLKDENQPITQVAYRLGYSDSTNFSRAFQAVSGVSPRDFRQSWLASRDSKERAARSAKAS